MKPKNATSKNTIDLPKKSKSIRLIAVNIKHFRTQLGISQEYLAELADLHRNYVGQLERFEVNISVISLENIAKALKIEVKDLLIKQPGLSYK
jgi:transcriptional regulator with XRE-family HTH domain